MDVLQYVIHVPEALFWFLRGLPTSTWQGFFVLLGSGVGISVLTELYKRRVNTRKERELAKKTIALLLSGLAGVVTLAQSVIQQGQLNPHFLGPHTLEIVGIAYSVYHFGGSKVYSNIAATLNKIKAIADAYNEETGKVSLASAAPTTTPIPGTAAAFAATTPAPSVVSTTSIAVAAEDAVADQSVLS